MCKLYLTIPEEPNRTAEIRKILVKWGLAFKFEDGIITVDEKPGEKIASATADLKNAGFTVKLTKPNE